MGKEHLITEQLMIDEKNISDELYNSDLFLEIANHGWQDLQLNSVWLPEITDNLKKVFNDIIKTGELKNTDELTFFLQKSDDYRTMYVLDKGNLQGLKATQLDEKETDNIPLLEKNRSWKTLYIAPFSYYLIQFLKNINLKRLKKCRYCSKFFLSDDIRRQRCYSDDCRKIFEKERKRKQRSDNPAKYC